MNINMLFNVVNILILTYTAIVCICYLVLGTTSLISIRTYIRRNRFLDYRQILASPMAPGVSLIAPAYNEGLTIIDNVRSLLSVMYNNFDVIIINDGSKDDTMEKLIAAFSLVRVNYDVQHAIATKKVRGVYKSGNGAFKKLIVVDKENGGKADALNAGLNVSSKDLVACIDVDCVLEPDSLLKMVKPFLEDKKVVASGGVVRIANSCVIEGGRLVKIYLPQNLLSRVQVLEYLRSFLLARMAWSRINGLLLISGAFGMFKREVAVHAGGYNPRTVGEDMELVVRMRRFLEERNIKYSVAFIPDPLCWTEAPSTPEVLACQRNRWARGTFETLSLHRRIFFNPKYGVMGMLSYPYWFFYEWLSPLVESAGLILLAVLALTGKVSWVYFGSLLGAVCSFSFFISVLALFAEEKSFFKYTQKRDVFRMIITAIIEPFWYHPRTVWWAIKGHVDLIKGKKSWGDMTRQGFNTCQPGAASPSI